MSWDSLFHVPFILMLALLVHAFTGKLIEKGMKEKVYYPLLILTSTGFYLLIFLGIGLIQFRTPAF
jgi:hypothetical protein